MGVFLCFLFFLSFPLFGSEQITVTDTETFVDGQEVQIRGFLYHTNDKKLVLAEEPNLRSCCVGRPGTNHKQIAVSGNFPNQIVSGSAVLVQGRMVVNDSSYRLENAFVVDKKTGGMRMVWMGIGCILVIVAVIVLLLKRNVS